jgi:hypothetical protein
MFCNQYRKNHLYLSPMTRGSVQDKYNELWTEEVWRLYYALTRTVEEEHLPLLDVLDFSDFITFCRKYTSSATSKAGEDRLVAILLEEQEETDEPCAPSALTD